MKIAILAALLASPAAAYAGHHSCTGGNSGGSSSGGGGGGGHVSTSSYEAAPSSSSGVAEGVATGCIDDTDVVGYRRCTKFGVWGNNMRIPRMFVELGSNVRQFSSMLGDHTGTVSHGVESFQYRTVMSPSGESLTDTAVTTALRVGFGLPHHLYTGAELELGGVVAPAAANAEMTTSGAWGSPDLEQRRGLLMGALSVAGVREASTRGALALEAAGGVRAVSYRFDSVYHDCESTAKITTAEGVVEARARAELWLGPWLTAGATLGTNVLSRGDWMAGLYLGVHSRAYAGSR